MVGGALARTSRGAPVQATDAPVLLSVRGLSVQTPLGSAENISLDVHAGECVGLFGLRGSGTTAVADAVAGLVKPSAGEIVLDSRPGYVPEDRHARGFVPTLGVSENLTLPILERLSRWGIVSSARRESAAGTLVARLQIVSSGGDQPVSELSGGNQQKVVVGRALSAEPSVLVVVNPTVGVDVASKEALLGVVDGARAEGCAVLLVSDDLEELRICARVLVLRRGEVVREFTEPPWDRHALIATAEGLTVAA
jgi:simple sugar transport system ATP-binding protein